MIGPSGWQVSEEWLQSLVDQLRRGFHDLEVRIEMQIAEGYTAIASGALALVLIAATWQVPQVRAIARGEGKLALGQ